MQKIFAAMNQYLVFIILAVVILYFGKTFLIPLAFAMLLAMLMAPVCRRLDSWRFPRPLSAFVCVLILMLVLAGIVLVVRAQVGAFTKDVGLIEAKAREFVSSAQQLIEDKTGMSEEKQKAAIKKQTDGAGGNASAMVGKFLSGLTSTIATIVLTLVLTFLFLFGKEKYETFFLKLFARRDPEKVRGILRNITNVGQKYLTGRAMSVTIIWLLYSIGLSVVGIKNAIILAAVAALLTVIPYLGTVLGGLFPVAMALVTEDSLQPAFLAVFVMFAIQTMDNYFIEPNVVGGEVNLSAMFSILSILVGGVLWGIAGMILFLPLLGIVKIVCDNIPALEPIGYLVGDQKNNRDSAVVRFFGKLFSKRRR